MHISFPRRTTRKLFFLFMFLAGFELVTSTKLSPEPGGLCSSSVQKCDIRSEGRRLTCSGMLHGIHAIAYSIHLRIRFLSLCKWHTSVFTPDLLRIYPEIEKFTLWKSTITHLMSDFPPLYKLKVIVMSNLGLQVIDPTTFTHVPRLRVLDLRSNQLLTLGAAILDNHQFLHQVFLAGKDYICKDDLIWVSEDRYGTLIQDRDQMICGEKYPDLRVEPIMQILKKMNAQCPSLPPYNCMCLLDNAVQSLPPLDSEEIPIRKRFNQEQNFRSRFTSREAPPSFPFPTGASFNPLRDSPSNFNFPATDEGFPAMDPEFPESPRSLIPLITVDCSYRNLTQLPHFLPDNTTTVLALGNQITDISLPLTNINYSHILDLILDYNPIKSLDHLEGATWLKTFRNLSLRGNKLSQLPTYALDNALEVNPNVNLLQLGDNPWRCDCGFTPGFQDLLVKYETVIEDPLSIRCAWSEEASISLQPIRTLSRSLICASDQSNIQPLVLLNIGLLVSIIFIGVKFVYDYFMYKKFGQLPWIITVVP
uniref:Protein singed wings 2 n=1 Tax=Cacopsylla melanoneura TaxID=428564 RepID=A0A8D9F801_9HEMI